MSDIQVLNIAPADNSAGRCRAIVSVRVGPFAYHRVRLVLGRDGSPFLGWPARQDELGRWIASVEVLDRDLDREVLSAVLAAVDSVAVTR